VSYFETTLSNEWSYPEACKFYVHLYKDNIVTFQQMKKDLLNINKNPNYCSLPKKKARLRQVKPTATATTIHPIVIAH
jgi:hypothetical protein